MMIRLSCFALAGVVALSACAANKPLAKTGDLPSRTVLAMPTSASETQLMALSDAQLPAGKCGMLLWMVDGAKPVMVFRAVRDEQAEMMINKVPVRLTLLDQNGDRRFGMAANQSFLAADGVTKVSIQTNYGQSFPGGIYVQDGLVNVINAKGWESVIPVAGLAGCRSE